MNELAKHQPGPATLPEKMDYARALAESGMLPAQYRRQPANLLYALEYAGSLGLHPMAAITGVHVIEGKPSASSALISALVRRAGHKLRVTGNDQEAVAQIIRADDPDWKFESRWTIARAEQAGLTKKQVWRNYPAAMLKARAITEVARDACEEALSGMHYTPEELGANVGEDGEPVDAEVQQLRRVPTGQTDQWSTPAAAPARDFVTEAREASDAEKVRQIGTRRRPLAWTRSRSGRSPPSASRCSPSPPRSPSRTPTASWTPRSWRRSARRRPTPAPPSRSCARGPPRTAWTTSTGTPRRR